MKITKENLIKVIKEEIGLVRMLNEGRRQYGFDLTEFTASPGTGGNLTIVPTSGSNLAIDTSFTGVSTVINNRTYYLGQEFTDGIALPEVKKYSGSIVYVDNRPSITRSVNQKEDITVLLQF